MNERRPYTGASSRPLLRLDLHNERERELLRSLLRRHVRASSRPGMNTDSATVARHLLRRLDP